MNKQPDRKRMQVFRASEGIPLDHDVMPWEGMDEATMAGMAKLAQVGAQTVWLKRRTCCSANRANAG